MVRPTEKYECPDCNDMHDWEEDAQRCCLPEVDSVFECAECEAIWYAFTDADFCCKEQEDC